MATYITARPYPFRNDGVFEAIRWSEIMNGDLSPKVIVQKLLAAGYEIIAENMPSPVGKVPTGSTVFTDHNEKRAVWIDGKLYQHPKVKA